MAFPAKAGLSFPGACGAGFAAADGKRGGDERVPGESRARDPQFGKPAECPLGDASSLQTHFPERSASGLPAGSCLLIRFLPLYEEALKKGKNAPV